MKLVQKLVNCDAFDNPILVFATPKQTSKYAEPYFTLKQSLDILNDLSCSCCISYTLKGEKLIITDNGETEEVETIEHEGQTLYLLGNGCWDFWFVKFEVAATFYAKPEGGAVLGDDNYILKAQNLEEANAEIEDLRKELETKLQQSYPNGYVEISGYNF